MLKIHYVSLFRMHNRVFDLDAVFDAIWVPTWLDLGTLLRAKWAKHRARSRLKMQLFLRSHFIDFGIDFGTIWAPNLA